MPLDPSKNGPSALPLPGGCSPSSSAALPGFPSLLASPGCPRVFSPWLPACCPSAGGLPWLDCSCCRPRSREVGLAPPLLLLLLPNSDPLSCLPPATLGHDPPATLGQGLHLQLQLLSALQDQLAPGPLPAGWLSAGQGPCPPLLPSALQGSAGATADGTRPPACWLAFSGSLSGLFLWALSLAQSSLWLPLFGSGLSLAPSLSRSGSLSRSLLL